MYMGRPASNEISFMFLCYVGGILLLKTTALLRVD